MIYFGLFVFSSVLGYLLGASNTPVVGTFITAILGLAGVVMGGRHLVDTDDKKTLRQFIGITCLTLAIGLISGELIGESYRNNWYAKVDKTFPWEKHEAPKNTFEAIDWIVLQEQLLSLGYETEDVHKLYKLRFDERAKLELLKKTQTEQGLSDYEQVSVYDTDTPYSSILKTDQSKPTAGRGPASTLGQSTRGLAR